jgi:outer membrane lipoprotein-sorting protein
MTMFKAVFMAAILAAGVVLSGCVTAEEMAAQNAQADDSSCQSYGATAGSSEYYNCRMTKDQTRTYISAIQAEAARQQFNHGLEMIAANHGWTY